jgi:nicotinamide phosphoribosyltransferase
MLHILSEGFGFTVNDKGYRVLNNVRIIWGDGINEVTISSILRVVVDIMGYSADNIGFGMGGALLQIVNRDTQRFAMKCSAIAVRVDMPDLTNENETQTTLEWRDVYKDPITDSGKTSKKGQVTLYKVWSEKFRKAGLIHLLHGQKFYRQFTKMVCCLTN